MVHPVPLERLSQIPGWFEEYDVDLFYHLLDETSRRFPRGDLAELGVYLGKSAVVIGSALRAGEEFTVIDLFGTEAGSPPNQAENDHQYPGLERDTFERNYRSVHSTLPQVITGRSSEISEHARAGTHRFVHVDASHMFDEVVADIAAARALLASDGVLVLDDFRSEHTPGVAAAAWQAAADGLHPFALTPVKMYATFGDPRPWRESVQRWVGSTRWGHEMQAIAGLDVVRLWWTPPVPDGGVPRGRLLLSSPARSVKRAVRRCRSRGRDA